MKQSASTYFSKFRNTFIGDRSFYATVFILILPLIVQNAITHFVNLLDNIMIGQIGTPQMSGVAIVNQLLFVFNLTIFGGLSGASIFAAQFFGAGDHDGLRYTVRFKLLTAAMTLVVAVIVFITCGDRLISLFLTGEGSAADRAAMLEYGRNYLRIMLWGLLPFSLSQVYGTTLREMGETVLPMKAGMAGVLTNLCLNYLLIFGKFGFPALGVEGAAIATAISRFVEFGIIAVYTHRHAGTFKFVVGLYKSLQIPRDLAFKIVKKGMPLLANEVCWSVGINTLTQIFSTRGLNIVGALNITSSATNLFYIFTFSMGTAVGVMVGQALGANDIPRAKQTASRLIFFNVSICIVVGGILAALSPFIPLIYNTYDEVRMMATRFMQVNAVLMAFNAISHCTYFTIRSGGKTFVTFLFDSAYMWFIFVPYAYVLTHYTTLNILVLYPLCYISDIVKSAIAVALVKNGRWAQNIVSDCASEENVEPNACVL